MHLTDEDVYHVHFDVWGQPCRTWFVELEDAISWLQTCYDKGFLAPRCIFHGSLHLVYNKAQLIEMMP